MSTHVSGSTMTTVEQADLFCEYYDFNELANLSGIGTNVEIASIAPSPESSNCPFTTTMAIEPAVLEAFSVVPEPSPAVPQAFPARSASPDVKEEPVDGFTGEISTDDEDEDEIEDNTDCVAQTDTEHPQPPFIPPEDIEDELLEAGSAENGGRMSRRPTTPPASASATTNKKNINNSSSRLVNHRDQVLVFTCLTCSYRTGRKANLHAHFKRQHIFDVSVSIEYIINTYCDTSWAAKTDYVKIVAQNTHGGRQVNGKNKKKKARKKTQLHSCFACEYKFGSKNTLERHLKERHAEHGTETEPSGGKKTAVVRKEKIADGEETGERKNGTISSAKTDQGAKWDSRTMSELREMRFMCTECDYRTKWRQNMAKHAKVRHGTYVGEFKKISMYCCKICSFSCVNLWNIKQHIMDKHQGEDGVGLAEDGKKMVGLGDVLKARNAKVVRDSSGKVAGKRKSDAIKDREPKKNQVKRRKLDSLDMQNVKIRCAKCAFSTRHVLSWKQHMIEVHGGRRSFTCDVCGDSFKTRETLNSHYLACHVRTVGMYICSQCHFRGRKKHKVRKHIMTKHKCCAKILRKK